MMTKSGISHDSKNGYQTLLNREQTVPAESLFGDNVFWAVCEKVRTRNESMVIQDIT
jgi:hypothetical protein